MRLLIAWLVIYANDLHWGLYLLSLAIVVKQHARSFLSNPPQWFIALTFWMTETALSACKGYDMLRKKFRG